MRKYTFFLLVIGLLAANRVSTQNLISAELLSEFTAEQINATYGGFGVTAENGISMYKVLYLTSVPWLAVQDTASGLLVIPDTYEGSSPFVAYQHGTTDGPASCPSRMTAGHLEAIAYGATGFVCSAADYLGLGDSNGFHPYLDANTEATAGLDMLIASLEFFESLTGEVWLGELFIAGYSQGGHASMALHQYIQENFSIIWQVKKAAHMSGPYDLSGTMKDVILGDDPYLFSGYIAYIILGYQQVYGNLFDELGDIFKATYVPAIEQFYNHEITLTEATTQLSTLLFVLTGAVVPKRMLQDSVINQVETDENHPLNVALEDNTLMDWVPEAPTRLYYCTADEQVPFMNSTLTAAAMTDAGAADVKAIDMDPEAGHGDCAPLAILESILFFKDMPTGTRDLSVVGGRAIRLAPNPAISEVEIGTDLPETGSFSIEIFSANGALMYKSNGHTAGETVRVVTTDWPAGLYSVIVNDGHALSAEKLVIL